MIEPENCKEAGFAALMDRMVYMYKAFYAPKTRGAEGDREGNGRPVNNCDSRQT